MGLLLDWLEDSQVGKVSGVRAEKIRFSRDLDGRTLQYECTHKRSSTTHLPTDKRIYGNFPNGIAHSPSLEPTPMVTQTNPDILQPNH